MVYNEATGRTLQIGKVTYNKLLKEGYQVTFVTQQAKKLIHQSPCKTIDRITCWISARPCLGVCKSHRHTGSSGQVRR